MTSTGSKSMITTLSLTTMKQEVRELRLAAAGWNQSELRSARRIELQRAEMYARQDMPHSAAVAKLAAEWYHRQAAKR